MIRDCLMGANIRYFWLPIGIAGWTILQSLAHVWWILYGREMIACEIKVKRKVEFYLYLTYLYSNQCDNYSLNEYATINFNHTNMTRNMDLASAFKSDGTMTDSLMNLYLGMDAVWIVTAVSLLIGVIMRLKQCSALIFFFPWILLAIATLGIDLFSSLYFGLQMPKAEIIQSPFPWKLDYHAIMAIIAGRLGLIWITNLLNVMYILWFTRVSYGQRYSDEHRSASPRLHKMRRQDTENRIKSWQLFYGAIEDDLNYTTTFKDLEEYNNKRKHTLGSINEQEMCSTFKSTSSVNESADTNAPSQTTNGTNGNKKKVQITELVSHLPWSYIETKKKWFPKSESKMTNHSNDNDDAAKCGKVSVVELNEQSNYF